MLCVKRKDQNDLIVFILLENLLKHDNISNENETNQTLP